jgi:exodeoxyribonuclease V alpha subunit
MAEFQIDNIIRVAKELELLDRIDVVFADFIRKLEGNTEASKYLYLAVLFVSKATNSKHTCFDLSSLAGGHIHDLIEDETGIPEDLPNLKFPNLDVWLAKINQCIKTVVKEEDATDIVKHIVVTGDGSLYLHKYWKYEQVVIAAINDRKSQRRVVEFSRDDLKPAFEGLQNTKWQEIAVFTALCQQVAIITGGPGTGKTTTVATVLAILQGQNKHISMVAPTGKAAQRLKESIKSTKSKNSFFESIPEEAETIHKFLGYNPGSRSYKYNRYYRRPTDVLIVDEASMVSLSLFDKLVDALKPSCKIILLGDKDQLAAVETGSVLSELTNVNDINAFSSESVACMQKAGFDVQDINKNDNQSFLDLVVKLVYSHRFNSQSAIGVLSQTINDAESDVDIDAVNDVFARTFEKGEVSHIEIDENNFYAELKKLINPFVKGYKKILKDYEKSMTSEGDSINAIIDRILTKIDEYKVLCAYSTNELYGAIAINNYIEKTFFSKGLAPFYNGKIIMIIKNDRMLGLANGDVGVILQGEDEAMYAFFRSLDDDFFQKVPVSALPEYTAAFAATIHKSQGSEYDNVIMVLGDRVGKLLTKELVYTGITRAKKTVAILAGVGVLGKASICRTKRSSRIQKFL